MDKFKFLSYLQNNSSPFKNLELRRENPELIDVPMGFTEVTSANKAKPLIGTASLASCLGIAIYDESTKVGGVSHIFFNDKVERAVYLKDSRGMDIPSTGRAVYYDDPNPFRRIEGDLLGLLSKAKVLGGSKFKLYFFNAEHGVRSEQQNIVCKQVCDETSFKFASSGDIADVEFRNEHAFILDTRTGSILPH